jgi:hypothetical protein
MGCYFLTKFPRINTILLRKLTDTACKTTQVVAADNDARIRVGRVLKLIQPILVLQDATKHALIIAKEHEGDQAAYRDASLERFPLPEPGTHNGGVCGICEENLEKRTKFSAEIKDPRKRYLLEMQLLSIY